MTDYYKQFQLIQRLMKDENFKKFMAHPKVKEAFRDPDLKTCASQGNYSALLVHPKFRDVLAEPELSDLMEKIKVLLSGS